MSSEVSTPTGGSSPTPITTSAAQPSGADLSATGFRYAAGPNVPDWLVGKTAAEAATIAAQLYSVAASGSQRPAGFQQGTQPQTTPPQNYQQQSAAPALPSNDDWLTDPTAAFNKAAASMQQQTFQPYFDQMASATAANARALAEQRYTDDFRRYGPEIQVELSRVPVQMQTFDNIRMVVDLVRGRHASELANELAEQRIQERMTAGTLRPSTSGGDGLAPTIDDSLSLDKAGLSPEYLHVLRLRGIGEKDLDGFLRKYYGPDVDIATARKDWFEKAKSGQVINEGSGWGRTLSPVGGAK